jgi:cytochrome b561
MFCGLSVISFLVLRTLWRLHSDKPSASMQPLLRMHIYSIAIMTCILFSYYCCALSGTSSIDEEHQTWYFMIQTIWFIQVLVW